MGLQKLTARLPFTAWRSSQPTVAVLRLSGVIGRFGPLRSGLTLESLAGTIERAFKLPRAKAVALALSSPGGSPVQSALIAKRIRDLASEKEIPVIAFVEDVAASGGYWLACAADEIYADQSSIVGSIGVISAGFGFPKLLERIGVERRLHTAGDKKSLLDPFQPEDPEDVERLRRVQLEIHQSFKDHVRARRGGKLKADEETLFSGEFWTGARALELGLVDGIADLRGELRRRYGEKVRLRVVQMPQQRWRRYLRFGAAVTESQDWASAALAAAEERALWSRYGL